MISGGATVGGGVKWEINCNIADLRWVGGEGCSCRRRGVKRSGEYGSRFSKLRY